MKAEWDRADGCAGGQQCCYNVASTHACRTCWGGEPSCFKVAPTHACRTVVCVELPFRALTPHSVGERGPAPAAATSRP
eukprot:6130204-Prymnesium_polylepis.1